MSEKYARNSEYELCEKREYHRVTILFIQESYYCLKIRTPIMIGLDHNIKKRGYIWIVTKGREVWNTYKITREFIFYGIICIVMRVF